MKEWIQAVFDVVVLLFCLAVCTVVLYVIITI